MSVTIRAVDPDGLELCTVPLPHGGDPRAVLDHCGYTWLGVKRAWFGEDGRLVIEAVAGDRPTPEPTTGPTSPPVESDKDVRLAPGELPRVRQRIAAYALVETERGVLLTELSEKVRAAAGRWTLPGGGLDEGEDPRTGLIREVWEETGQHVTDIELVDVRTGHWVGVAPDGHVEDFHSVRLVHTARCAEPTDAVVHDLDGSTSAAAWVPRTQLEDYPLAPMLEDTLTTWLSHLPTP